MGKGVMRGHALALRYVYWVSGLAFCLYVLVASINDTNAKDNSKCQGVTAHDAFPHVSSPRYRCYRIRSSVWSTVSADTTTRYTRAATTRRKRGAHQTM